MRAAVAYSGPILSQLDFYQYNQVTALSRPRLVCASHLAFPTRMPDRSSPPCSTALAAQSASRCYARPSPSWSQHWVAAASRRAARGPPGCCTRVTCRTSTRRDETIRSAAPPSQFGVRTGARVGRRRRRPDRLRSGDDPLPSYAYQPASVVQLFCPCLRPCRASSSRSCSTIGTALRAAPWQVGFGERFLVVYQQLGYAAPSTLGCRRPAASPPTLPL